MADSATWINDEYSPHPEAIVAVVGSEAVILMPASGMYYGLNQVAARVWQLLQEGVATRALLLDHILDEFEVDRSTLDRDLDALLADLSRLDLVTVATRT